MSVLIRGMEMPKSCWDCEFEAPTIDHHECCILTKKSYNWGLTTRPSDCPLVSVPPHGRLIDADAAAKQGWTISRTYSASPTEMVHEVNTIEAMPTIIPADGGEQMTDPLVAIGDGLYDAFEWGYAQGKKDATKWISVNERLPKEWWPVLGLIQFHDEKEPPVQQVLWYLGNGHWRETWRGDMIESDVTHWMPLPEPPKDGDQ